MDQLNHNRISSLAGASAGSKERRRCIASGFRIFTGSVVADVRIVCVMVSASFDAPTCTTLIIPRGGICGTSRWIHRWCKSCAGSATSRQHSTKHSSIGITAWRGRSSSRWPVSNCGFASHFQTWTRRHDPKRLEFVRGGG